MITVQLLDVLLDGSQRDVVGTTRSCGVARRARPRSAREDGPARAPAAGSTAGHQAASAKPAAAAARGHAAQLPVRVPFTVLLLVCTFLLAVQTRSWSTLFPVSALDGAAFEENTRFPPIVFGPH